MTRLRKAINIIRSARYGYLTRQLYYEKPNRKDNDDAWDILGVCEQLAMKDESRARIAKKHAMLGAGPLD